MALSLVASLVDMFSLSMITKAFQSFYCITAQTCCFPQFSAQVLSVLCIFFHPYLLCSSSLCVHVPAGSLVVESAPGNQLGGFQGISHHLPHPGQVPSGSPHSFAPGAPHNTLAQLQMQVDKLNPLAHWQPQPPPPPWTWYQSVRLQRTVPEPLQGGAPSYSMPPQPGRRFMVPPPSHVSPTSSLLSPGFTPQVSVRYFVWVCMCARDWQALLTSTDSRGHCPK